MDKASVSLTSSTIFFTNKIESKTKQSKMQLVSSSVVFAFAILSVVIAQCLADFALPLGYVGYGVGGTVDNLTNGTALGGL